MPELDRRTSATLKVYQRCSERKSLPWQGGVMDQPEALMAEFDAIDEQIAEFRKKKEDNQAREEELKKLRRGIRGRH